MGFCKSESRRHNLFASLSLFNFANKFGSRLHSEENDLDDREASKINQKTLRFVLKKFIG